VKRTTPEGQLSTDTRKLLQDYKERGLLYFYRVSSSTTIGNGRRVRSVDRGISDYLIMLKGQTHYLELKTASGKQSTSQKEFQSNVTMHQCPYYICRSIFEVAALLDRIV